MINDEWWLIINHYFSLWINVHHDKSWIAREWFTSLYTTGKKTRCQWVVAAKPPLMGDYTSQYIGDYPWNCEITFNQPERWNDIGKLNTAQMKIDKFTDKNGINRDLSQQDHLAPSRSPLQPCSIHGPHGLYVLKNTDASDRMLQWMTSWFQSF